MLIKAVMFDFDGTLANTLPICYEAFRRVFEKFDDKKVNSDEISAMFGPSETGIIRENLLSSNKDEAIELYYDIYKKSHHQFVNPNSEIVKLLSYLKENHVKIGIVTGKARRSLDMSLEALFLKGFFDVIITGDDVVHPKPDPEGVVKALALLEVEESEAMYLGDSDADIEAGIRANVFTGAVHWLLDYQPIEWKVKPDMTFSSVTELIEFLEKGDQHEL